MIEIRTKNDIKVPFEKIGAESWEATTREILDSILETYGDDPVDASEETQILELEKRLGTALPQGLKSFYTTFGIANIGEELLQLPDIGWLKDIWADQPQYGPDFSDEDKVSLPFLVTFSDYLGNGNMFCFHGETKEVYYFDHDSTPYLTKMFSKVDDYIKGCLIFAQDVLPAEGVDTDDVQKWIEEKVIALFGEETVRKWRY